MSLISTSFTISLFTFASHLVCSPNAAIPLYRLSPFRMPFNLRPRPSRTPDIFIDIPQRTEKPKSKKKHSTSTRKPIMSTPTTTSTALSRGPLRKLDLDHSYVGGIEPPRKAPKTQRHKRWKHFGEPLEDTTQLPEDWTDSEPDLSDEWGSRFHVVKWNVLMTRAGTGTRKLKDAKSESKITFSFRDSRQSWRYWRRRKRTKSNSAQLFLNPSIN